MMLHVRQTLPWGRRGLTTRQMAGLDSDGSDCMHHVLGIRHAAMESHDALSLVADIRVLGLSVLYSSIYHWSVSLPVTSRVQTRGHRSCDDLPGSTHPHSSSTPPHRLSRHLPATGMIQHGLFNWRRQSSYGHH